MPDMTSLGASNNEPPPVRIRIAGQALRYLENCGDEEFHILRGEILLLSTNPGVNNRDIIALPRPRVMLRLYLGNSYHITYFMNDLEIMVVLNIRFLFT